MNGSFGVFDGAEKIAEFCDDVAAQEYRHSALELDRPEGFRMAVYDDLQVREVPVDYDRWWRLLAGLKASRNADLAIQRAMTDLKLAQWERQVLRSAA